MISANGLVRLRVCGLVTRKLLHENEQRLHRSGYYASLATTEATRRAITGEPKPGKWWYAEEPFRYWINPSSGTPFRSPDSLRAPPPRCGKSLLPLSSFSNLILRA